MKDNSEFIEYDPKYLHTQCSNLLALDMKNLSEEQKKLEEKFALSTLILDELKNIRSAIRILAIAICFIAFKDIILAIINIFIS